MLATSSLGSGAVGDANGQLTITNEGEEIVALSLEGEFDLANSHLIREHADKALRDDKHLILDLSQVTFIESSVINSLFTIQRNAQTRRRIAVLQLGTAAIVEHILELSGLERVLPRTKNRTDAIQTIHDYAPQLRP
jgi:anti-anti-sigma factor